MFKKVVLVGLVLLACGWLIHMGQTSPLRHYTSDGSGCYQAFHRDKLLTHSYDAQQATYYQDNHQVRQEAYRFDTDRQELVVGDDTFTLDNHTSYAYEIDGETVIMVKVSKVPTYFHE